VIYVVQVHARDGQHLQPFDGRDTVQFSATGRIQPKRQARDKAAGLLLKTIDGLEVVKPIRYRLTASERDNRNGSDALRVSGTVDVECGRTDLWVVAAFVPGISENGVGAGMYQPRNRCARINTAKRSTPDPGLDPR
jgi:hypothetical protein